ncbi:MAG: putative sugar nucleotidyl transferase [Ardenticatenaceae bacterium]
MSSLVLFEDKAASRFLPLAWTRPVFGLRCGIWTLRQAVEQVYGTTASALFVRDFLAEVVRERTGLPVNEVPAEGMSLLLNGRLLADRELPRRMPMFGEPRRYVALDGTLLGAWVESGSLVRGFEAVEALPVQVLDPLRVEWPWELFQFNAAAITKQAVSWPLGERPAMPGVSLLSPERIFVAPSARVQPGVVLDATDGPIVIDGNATILANAVLQGPAYVGTGSSIKIGAKIYHGTTIGPLCKVGGEVEESIFHGYSNKQHDGFLGHSYVGEWCNFGAGSTNSDLKNTYSTVSMWCEGTLRDTGSLFVGLLMGDHSKTGISSTLNTGTVVGVSCNLFGAGLSPKVVPSFSWGGAGAWNEYRLERALETAERVMARRDTTLSPAERALLRYIFEATAGERRGVEERGV